MISERTEPIKLKTVPNKILSIEDKALYGNNHVSRLACGHTLTLQRDTATYSDPATGFHVEVGQDAGCWLCGQKIYEEALTSRPQEKAERFETREALLKAHPGAAWHEYGPVHRYGDTLYVVTYLGAHQWLAFNVDDLRDVHPDPGWEGTDYGQAYVPEIHVKYAMAGNQMKPELEPPERLGKPITGDMYLFADQDKLEKYLGPDDPLMGNGKALTKTEPQ